MPRYRLAATVLVAIVRWVTHGMLTFESQTYLNAPLIEVALSVQFQPLINFTSAHAGDFWGEIRSEFPIAQEQPLLGPIDEIFGTASQLRFGFQFIGPGIRNWFVSQDQSYLLQIQKDRFAINWRKTASTPEYPRYPAIRDRFLELFSQFEKYLGRNEVGACDINIYEVSYINQWRLKDGQRIGDGLNSWLKMAPKNVAKLHMEAASLSVQYLVSEDGKNVGRLYANINPIKALDGADGVNLELMCRIIPFDMGEKFRFRPLDLAREHIVTTFGEITSDSAQKVWRGE
jgi:uncharacterized protein (TIGR04255 family)